MDLIIRLYKKKSIFLYLVEQTKYTNISKSTNKIMWRAHHTWRNPPQLMRPTNARHSRACWDRTVKNYDECGKRLIGGDILENVAIPDHCTPTVEFEDEDYSETLSVSATSSTCSVNLQESYSYLDLDNTSEVRIVYEIISALIIEYYDHGYY